jgi:SAM-dependent methyltransferase
MDRYVRLERRRDGWLREYCMTDGSPVLLRLGPFGLQLSSVESTRDPISRRLGIAYLERRRRRGLPELDRTYPLIHPIVTADERVVIVEWSALERKMDFGCQFDAIRASNILNENYFSRKEIECVLSHLHTYLIPGGWLVVSRNHPERDVESEHGSLWRQTKAGFERLVDFGSGSYVAHIVDEFAAAENR